MSSMMKHPTSVSAKEAVELCTPAADTLKRGTALKSLQQKNVDSLKMEELWRKFLSKPSDDLSKLDIDHGSLPPAVAGTANTDLEGVPFALAAATKEAIPANTVNTAEALGPVEPDGSSPAVTPILTEPSMSTTATSKASGCEVLSRLPRVDIKVLSSNHDIIHFYEALIQCLAEAMCTGQAYSPQAGKDRQICSRMWFTAAITNIQQENVDIRRFTPEIDIAKEDVHCSFSGTAVPPGKDSRNTARTQMKEAIRLSHRIALAEIITENWTSFIETVAQELPIFAAWEVFDGHDLIGQSLKTRLGTCAELRTLLTLGHYLKHGGSTLNCKQLKVWFICLDAKYAVHEVSVLAEQHISEPSTAFHNIMQYLCTHGVAPCLLCRLTLSVFKWLFPAMSNLNLIKFNYEGNRYEPMWLFDQPVLQRYLDKYRAWKRPEPINRFIGREVNKRRQQAANLRKARRAEAEVTTAVTGVVEKQVEVADASERMDVEGDEHLVDAGADMKEGEAPIKETIVAEGKAAEERLENIAQLARGRRQRRSKS
ncbi:hypothetical protein CALVIDRAFT_530003 [Calocera viscosa TUFC12733]|uniref:Uncharacterized protein n=1 Tax=Calocera viscosa (strain TUFC12733) TaxID=1330018 RepID=A0A167IJ48_CALVF|nr:hypothetical protein CALVIDRAFT_530003 [Calocera viscosa TUFC12733]